MADLRPPDQGGTTPVTPNSSHHREGYSTSDTNKSASQRGGSSRLTPSSYTKASPSPSTDDTAHDDSARKKRNRGSGSFLLQPSSSLRRSRSQRPPISMSIFGTKPTETGRPDTADSQLKVSYNTEHKNLSSSSQGSFNDAGSNGSYGYQAGGNPSQAELDSAQLVHTALSLRESRRVASQRSFPRSTPPRLAPMPDSSTSNDLRKQLKQRRASQPGIKAIVPSQRAVSGPRISHSSRQPTFDIAQDSTYQYHFSASTLARAQKAKQSLELMAQYRRLLEVLPPLSPRYNRPVASTPPGSPLSATKVFSWNSANRNVLGRKYNPLQYIRNRKVRARERRVIDGEHQGFGDTDEVRLWVDKIYQDNALSTSRNGEHRMPPFPGADALTQSAPRARRARVDWFIEPCDIIADAYWLELDDNRELIEDRNWHKIFLHDLSRPMSRQLDEAEDQGTFQPLAPMQPASSNEAPGSHARGESLAYTGTVRRSKDHTKDLGQWISQDENDSSKPRSKHSASELSESEHEKQNGTITNRNVRASTSASQNPPMEEQMLEMIAQDDENREASEIPATEIGHLVPPSMITPERNANSKPSSRFQSRRGSLAEHSDSDHKTALEKLRTTSPPRFRFGHHKESTPPSNADPDSSLPTSPEMRAHKSHTDPPPELDIAPWSRPTSPTRNPISKIRHILHEKSSDAHADSSPSGPETETSFQDNTQSPESTTQDGSHVDIKRSSTTLESSRGHHRNGSLRHRHDDTVGLRGIFKGHTIRGSVSKIGDILRKKDGGGETGPEDSDDSDSDHDRGRPRKSTSGSRPAVKHAQENEKKPEKHFLDTMPEFHHAPNALARSSSQDNHKEPSMDPTTRKKSGELLSPPPMGIRSSSSSVSPQRKGSGLLESDFSEAESVQSRMLEGIRDANTRLNSVISIPDYDTSHRKSRQWSIADDRHLHPDRTRLSRRDVARLRTLVLSSGIKAMEINRRANQKHKPFAPGATKDTSGIPWSDMQKLCANEAKQVDRHVPFYEMYSIAAQSLSLSIQMSGQRWQASMDRFRNATSPELHRRIGSVRSRLGDDLSEIARKATDEADATSKNLALDQPLKVKHVIDIIEKMLRKRRRRLRWVRRALWLSVEWLVVGFMWYVWFVVTILRVFVGIGTGVWQGVRWMLWL